MLIADGAGAQGACSAPAPSRRHYALLGLRHGASLAVCVEAYEHFDQLFDPRRHPDQQHWGICHQNDLDEAMALIVDAARWAGRAA